MNHSKKGIAGYLIALSITTLILTSLFMIISDSIYEAENPICEEIKFTILDQCIDGNHLRFRISNGGQGDLDFLLNNKNLQSLSKLEAKNYFLETKDIQKIKITPVIKIRDEIDVCKSQTQTIDILTISKKC